MSVKLENELQRILGSPLDIEERNGKYILTGEQLGVLLNEYSELWRLLKKLLAERQRLEFMLTEDKLKKLGIKKVDEYLN